MREPGRSDQSRREVIRRCRLGLAILRFAGRPRRAQCALLVARYGGFCPCRADQPQRGVIRHWCAGKCLARGQAKSFCASNPSHAIGYDHAAMSPSLSRTRCPTDLCDCQLDSWLNDAAADRRLLLLTRIEERRLLERLERLESLEDLQHMQQRMQAQLGISVQVEPGFNEVRSMRGIEIEVAPLAGLCRKSRQAIVRSIRRGMERTPQIAWALLNAQDLLRDA